MSVLTKLYDDYATASRAASEVDALRLSGVQTSIVGGETLRDGYAADPYYDTHRTVDDDTSATATGAGVGAAVGGGAGLLAGLGIMAIPGIGPLVAAGWLAATAVGAAGGAAAGGAVGALVDVGIDDDDAPVYSEAFRRGQVALSIRFPEDARMAVQSALSRVPDHDVADLRLRYEDDGWRHDETDAEREARMLRMNQRPML
ncbi:hypothetical protein EOK75_02115 [Pseudorhodobacter turbinis]|uniref:General stress protein 17M-like domain-containing protein n=1 Tax=Pseudorhodobacter turbinis TaxID=2500533 RepID=A0A4P8EE72_9RHOB|nr:hypothetical protein [Pseudorhodobacter turbinis]QCO54695.1 hypothetical protein EOK75_02115 [Pseudorhodobacter turbinis]